MKRIAVLCLLYVLLPGDYAVKFGVGGNAFGTTDSP